MPKHKIRAANRPSRLTTFIPFSCSSTLGRARCLSMPREGDVHGSIKKATRGVHYGRVIPGGLETAGLPSVENGHLRVREVVNAKRDRNGRSPGVHPQFAAVDIELNVMRHVAVHRHTTRNRRVDI